MARKTDQRTLRTRSALLAAFRELVLTRGFEAVTVGDIIRRANIARSTFYLHFTNKHTLLKHSLDGPCAGLAACVEAVSPPESLVPLLEHFREQRAVNRVFFEIPVRTIWVRRRAELIERTLQHETGGLRGPSPARLPRRLIALAIAETQVSLITHWLSMSGAVKPGRLAEALVSASRALAGR